MISTDDATPSPFERFSRALEGASILDAPATLVSRGVRAALDPGPVKDALSGTWLGHALHPLLTDVVLGSFLSASALDLLGAGGDSVASRRLIMVGVAAYAPTAITGLSDWIDGMNDPAVARVGIAHAGGNAVALTLFLASWRERRRGRGLRGAVLAGIGNAGLGAGAFLGGHLAFRQGIGPDQTAFDRGSEEWTVAAGAEELEPRRLLRVIAGDTPVLLWDSGEEIYAIHDRCSHRGCPLSDGVVEGHEVVCGCHFSRFDLRDGSLVRGPATAPQPAFDVRRENGRVEVRRRPPS